VKIEKDFQIVPGQATLDADEMLAALTLAGHSNTRARRAVLAAICEAGDQASPSELLALGQRHHPGLGLVTVYRTLEILLGLGLVRKLHSDEGCHTYAPVAHDHGHHVICQVCHQAMEFEGCDVAAVVASVEAQTGFQVRSHWLEMFGVCPACRAGE
jgi:Fur family ferric uptake transcriptional regulator